MPTKLRHPCRQPGCKELTHKRFCQDHSHERISEAPAFEDRRADRQFYNSAAWKRCRTGMLAREPLCRKCRHAAQMVDHIIPRHSGGEPFMNSNLQPLCNKCHAEKRSLESRTTVYK